MRAHAHVEDHIRRLKDSGAAWFAFVDADANREVPALGHLAHPARVVRHARRHVVRILDGWHTTDDILGAYRRLALIS